MWDTLFHLGHLRRTLPFHLQGINIFRKMSITDRRRGYAGHAASACCLSRGALLHWFTGFIDQSVQMSDDAIEEATELEHSNSCAHVFCHAALLRLLRREPQQAREYVTRAMEYARKHSIEPRLILCRMLLCAGELLSDPREATIVELHQDFERSLMIGARVFETFWQSSIAEAYLRIGKPDSGLTFVESAHRTARKTKEQFYIPEIHRLKGELLIAKSKKNKAVAERELRTAVELARESGAQTLELRNLVSLYNFLVQHGGTAGRKKTARRWNVF